MSANQDAFSTVVFIIFHFLLLYKLYLYLTFMNIQELSVAVEGRELKKAVK